MNRKSSPVANRPSMFRKTEERVPELEKQTAKSKIVRAKRTYHLPQEVVFLLNEIQLSEYRSSGAKPELSDLVAEAIKLLGESRHPDDQMADKQDS